MMDHNEWMERLKADGYPERIIGNGGGSATLVDVQPLTDGDYEAIYRYKGGDVVHDLDDIKFFTERERRRA